MEFQHTIAAGALLVAVLSAGCVAAQPRDGAPKGNAEARVTTTGLVGLPRGHKARLALVQSRSRAPDVQVEIRFKDPYGEVLARERSVIGPRNPVISQLFRRSVDTSDELLIQTEILFAPAARQQTRGASFAAPLPPRDTTTCPVLLTIEVVPEDDSGTGTSFACGVDPCSDGGGEDQGTQGPSHGSGVFPAFCDSPSTYGSDGNDA